MFWGLGIFLGILLCLFKKFEFLREGVGFIYMCVFIMDSKEDYMGIELRMFFFSV